MSEDPPTNTQNTKTELEDKTKKFKEAETHRHATVVILPGSTALTTQDRSGRNRGYTGRQLELSLLLQSTHQPNQPSCRSLDSSKHESERLPGKLAKGMGQLNLLQLVGPAYRRHKAGRCCGLATHRCVLRTWHGPSKRGGQGQQEPWCREIPRPQLLESLFVLTRIDQR